MTTITTDTLHDLGIHKSEAEEAALIEHFTATLQERVGMTILDLLDDEQATQLLELTEKDEPDETTAWLQLTIPEYPEIVEAEYEILLGELADTAEKL